MGQQSSQFPGGRRSVADPMAQKSFDAKVKTHFDPKGKKLFDGYTTGPNFRKKTTAEVVGEVKQAIQDAPEAVEQQRVSRSARGMIKGYFRNFGTNEEAPKKDDKP
jgi:hypothetical protein